MRFRIDGRATPGMATNCEDIALMYWALGLAVYDNDQPYSPYTSPTFSRKDRNNDQPDGPDGIPL